MPQAAAPIEDRDTCLKMSGERENVSKRNMNIMKGHIANYFEIAVLMRKAQWSRSFHVTTKFDPLRHFGRGHVFRTPTFSILICRLRVPSFRRIFEHWWLGN